MIPSGTSQGAVSVEIIAVGNELLLGIVQDTNTHWLCKRLTGLGGAVRRCAIVPDDLEAIREELQRALSAERGLIVTMGGLGPTEDDMTLRAVAQALETPLEEHPEALELVEQRYQELAAEGRVTDATLTESRRKMARLPQGAEPLMNRVGTAPGVLIRRDESTIVALPGVPAELKDIVQNSLRPHLRELLGAGFYQERHLVVDLNDESRIAPLLKELRGEWPEVYIKSRPRSFQEGQAIWITLALGGEREDVEKRLDRLSRHLRERLEAEGLALREQSPED